MKFKECQGSGDFSRPGRDKLFFQLQHRCISELRQCQLKFFLDVCLWPLSYMAKWTIWACIFSLICLFFILKLNYMLKVKRSFQVSGKKKPRIYLQSYFVSMKRGSTICTYNQTISKLSCLCVLNVYPEGNYSLLLHFISDLASTRNWVTVRLTAKLTAQ